jgi:hypothetical protein
MKSRMLWNLGALCGALGLLLTGAPASRAQDDKAGDAEKQKAAKSNDKTRDDKTPKQAAATPKAGSAAFTSVAPIQGGPTYRPQGGAYGLPMLSSGRNGLGKLSAGGSRKASAENGKDGGGEKEGEGKMLEKFAPDDRDGGGKGGKAGRGRGGGSGKTNNIVRAMRRGDSRSIRRAIGGRGNRR